MYRELGCLLIGFGAVVPWAQAREPVPEALARCEISRINTNLAAGPPVAGKSDRECAFVVRYSFEDGVADRAFSCTVPAGQFSCTTGVSMQRDGVAGHPVGAWSDPYLDPADIALGCSYAAGFPSARMKVPVMNEVQVVHRFDCFKI